MRRLFSLALVVLLPGLLSGAERLGLTPISASKPLADNEAVNIVDLSVLQSEPFGGKIHYFIKCFTNANKAEQFGSVTLACHNVIGTTSCGFGTPDGVSLGDGTADLDAPSFTATAGTDSVRVNVTSNCTGITPTAMMIRWWIEGSPTTVTIK